ncbi:MAG: hypothetical protein PHU86_03775 [Patescibacteria group bacterium]|nr:hypothetical protein [Patescibacteria group bacterium]
MARANYDKANLNPHKEARLAMWIWSEQYAKTGLGSMQFYETYLSSRERRLCEQAIKDILKSRDMLPNEKEFQGLPNVS